MRDPLPSPDRRPGRTPRPRGTYAVKQVRGPFVKLPPHHLAVERPEELGGLVAELRTLEPQRLLAADLFSGAGGLSLGLEQAGITTVFAVDHDKEAVETHRHHFPGLTVAWDLSDDNVVEQVGQLLRQNHIDVLCGGPPCQPFSKAGRSGIRHYVRTGVRDAHDQRRDLWQSFLEVARVARPRAVIMENVPDMALDREMFILRTMVFELESMGYSVEERVAETWRFGVPQFRQRLVLVALRDGLEFNWPREVPRKTTVENAIGDLPVVEGGWRPEGGADGWAIYGAPLTEFQKEMRESVPEQDAHRIYDHITRPVRPDDLRAFELLDSNTRYSDLPSELKRYRDDIFDDKYKRLDANDLSRTITAHIAKDGYWYIHPTQNRTLTIREAARLQTFPDWFRFAGPPSAAFRQIGNAVPPALGRALGLALLTALDEPRTAAVSSERVAATLSAWFESTELQATPWLKASTRWQVISAELLLDKAAAEPIRRIWPVLRQMESPEATISRAQDVLDIGRLIGREGRALRVIAAAEALLGKGPVHDDVLEAAVAAKQLPESVAGLAALVVQVGDADQGEEPVIINKGVLRVASRFTGEDVDRRNRLTDGRLAVARMIGFGRQSRSAHLALMELANTICRPSTPDCPRCPLALWCATNQSDEIATSRLPFA
jgi:DNA (cytosine-5)-methyltransferase 1